MKPKLFDAVHALVGGQVSGGSNYPASYRFHDGQTPPTEKAVTDKLAELIAAYPLQELREKRNVLLASSDWTGLSDLALTNEKSAEWKLYRQQLRNLPDGLDTVEKVNAVTWPTKPE